jgi:hypothetical protein
MREHDLVFAGKGHQGRRGNPCIAAQVLRRHAFSAPKQRVASQCNDGVQITLSFGGTEFLSRAGNVIQLVPLGRIELAKRDLAYPAFEHRAEETLFAQFRAYPPELADFVAIRDHVPNCASIRSKAWLIASSSTQ